MSMSESNKNGAEKMDANKIKIDITTEEQQILIDSMRDRIGKLYRMSEAYRDGGNKEAQMDYLEEVKRVRELLAKITWL